MTNQPKGFPMTDSQARNDLPCEFQIGQYVVLEWIQEPVPTGKIIGVVFTAAGVTYVVRTPSGAMTHIEESELAPCGLGD
jgi:hypothetical protein